MKSIIFKDLIHIFMKLCREGSLPSSLIKQSFQGGVWIQAQRASRLFKLNESQIRICLPLPSFLTSRTCQQDWLGDDNIKYWLRPCRPSFVDLECCCSLKHSNLAWCFVALKHSLLLSNCFVTPKHSNQALWLLMQVDLVSLRSRLLMDRSIRTRREWCREEEKDMNIVY